MTDPYTVLGVARDASQDDIKRAFRKLARQHHPDLNPGDAAAESQFKAANAANDLLSDPDKRARFDRGEIDAEGQERGYAPPPGGGWRRHAESEAGARYRRHGAHSQSGFPGGDEADFSDLFGDFFRAQEGARGAAGPRAGRDTHYTLTVSFEDSIRGATSRLGLPDGRTLDVKIPPGIETGQTLRLRGQGQGGHGGGPAGDGLIEITVSPHPRLVRDGRDIRLVLDVPLKEAVLGGRVEVELPDGPVALRIPPRSDSGAVLRLRGRGVAASGGQPAGDAYATLRVVIGPQDEALDAFLRGWTPRQGDAS